MDDNAFFDEDDFSRKSYQQEALSSGAILREVGKSVKDLMHSEVNLVTLELKESGKKIVHDLKKTLAFGALLALSSIPFMAFLVLGLGQLLDDRYWLSSLIVSVVFAGLGGPLALLFFKRITNGDLQLAHTKNSLSRGYRIFKQKIDQVREAAKGEKYDKNKIHIH